jgi:ATP-binding cassette subfamily B protein
MIRVKSLYNKFDKKRKYQLLGLFLVMLLTATLEMLSISAALPFLNELTNISNSSTTTINTENNLTEITIWFLLITLSTGTLKIVLMNWNFKISFGIASDLGTKVYKKTLDKPYEWHISKNSSEMIASIEKVSAITFGIIIPIVQAVSSVVLSIAIIISLLIINSKITIITISIFFIIYTLISFGINPTLKKNSKTLSMMANKRIQTMQEGFGGIRDIIIDNSQDKYIAKFTKYEDEIRKSQSSNAIISGIPRYIIETLGLMIIALLAYLYSNEGTNTINIVPVIGSLAIGAQKLIPQLQQIFNSITSIKASESQLNDVLELLEENKPILNQSKQHNVFNEKRFNSLIKLENVSFKYNDDQGTILKNINLEINHGEKIGIIGKTGSGKSTLIDLMMGLLKPSEGGIFFEGNKIKFNNINELHENISHVPQSIYLSDSTISENISFGKTKEGNIQSNVQRAAKLAKLDDFIESLKDKYDTKVGERGIQLSGGQRQRIGIARALYKNTKIIFMDEATNSLDSHTEEEIIETINELNDSITIIMIAHRLSTLKNCDKIILMSNGNIEKITTYEEIVSNV